MKYPTIANVKTLDSREAAKMIDKDHAHLCRDIQSYIGLINQNPKLDSDQYFIESSYISGTGKNYKCYKLTKMGCEMVANKLTGQKGIMFTAEYVKRFNEMEQLTPVQLETDKTKQMRADAMLRNSRVRQAKLLQQLADMAVTDTAKQILIVQAANITAGEKILSLPKSNERASMTATDLCHKFNLKESWAGQLGKKLNKRLAKDATTGYETQTVTPGKKEVRQWNWYVDIVMPVATELEKNGAFAGHYKN